MDIGQLPDVEAYNRWLEYNDPEAPPATAEDIRAHYRRHPYAPTARPNLRPGIFQGQAGPLIPSPIISQQEQERRLQVFLDQTGRAPAELLNWRGTKILGEGNYGVVGLFEYDPLAPDQPKVKKVVVKQMHDETQGNLVGEANVMMTCYDASFSDHIVKVLPDESHVTNMASLRLMMEYCPQGSLQDLLDRRIARNLPFEEITLWRIFECLVDFCSVLEFGQELTLSNDPNVRPAVENKANDWKLVLHLDIKPDNIVMGNRNRKHTETPVCKLSDFGLASEYEEDLGPQEADARNEELRECGSPGYFSPEQFSPRWNFENWRETEIAGVFGSATNIWGIGAIMYHLVCLDPDPPNHLFPFTPDYLVNQAAAKGATYGPDIQAQRYSDTIKHMILECLYEKPAHRCKLQDMKYTIYYAIDKIIDESGPDGDDWADLELPEPGGPVIYPRSILPPAPAAPPAPAPPVLAPPLAPAVPAPAPFPVPGF